MSNRFTGRNAVVTGGGSGIGQAIARRLAAEGARVWVLDLALDAAEATAALIQAETGMPAFPLACDVSNFGEAADIDKQSNTDHTHGREATNVGDVTKVGDELSVTRAFAQIDHLDVLVNSAGVAHVGTLEQTTPADLDRLYQVNVKGTYHCMRAALPLLRKSTSPAILNLASIASKIGIADRFAYSMSKGAVLSMTLSVARDYVREGIRCNCLCPARIHTPFVDGYLEKNYPNDKERMFKQLSDYQPIGRMGTPEEVASIAAFLCSSEANFITGAAYDLDGGVISLR